MIYACWIDVVNVLKIIFIFTFTTKAWARKKMLLLNLFFETMLFDGDYS